MVQNKQKGGTGVESPPQRSFSGSNRDFDFTQREDSVMGKSLFYETPTTRSLEDLTPNARRNAQRNPRWSSQVSFQAAHLKRDKNFDHRGFRFAIRRAFRVSSSRERAVQKKHINGSDNILFYRSLSRRREVSFHGNFLILLYGSLS